MTLTDGDFIDPNKAVRVLTREMSNYIERIASEVGAGVDELWEISLAASGRMKYAEVGAQTTSASTTLNVPNSEVRSGGNRFQLWQAALLEVLVILGDPESRYRTGYNSADLRIAITQFFEAHESRASNDGPVE